MGDVNLHRLFCAVQVQPESGELFPKPRRVGVYVQALSARGPAVARLDVQVEVRLVGEADKRPVILLRLVKQRSERRAPRLTASGVLIITVDAV